MVILFHRKLVFVVWCVNDEKDQTENVQKVYYMYLLVLRKYYIQLKT